MLVRWMAALPESFGHLLTLHRFHLPRLPNLHCLNSRAPCFVGIARMDGKNFASCVPHAAVCA